MVIGRPRMNILIDCPGREAQQGTVIVAAIHRECIIHFSFLYPIATFTYNLRHIINPQKVITAQSFDTFLLRVDGRPKPEFKETK